MKAKTLTTLALAAVLGAPTFAATTPAAPAAPVVEKNWKSPAHKIYAQQLVDETFKKHEANLWSMTFHGTPPDAKAGTFTMFAGTFPERYGNPSSPDDIMVVEKGVTIIDPRYKKVADNPKKFNICIPLRTTSSENVGAIVLAFKPGKTEREYLDMANKITAELQAKIQSKEALFAAAK